EEEKKQAKVVTTINNPIPAIKQTVINSKNIIDAKVKEVADDSEVSTDNFVVSTQKLETTQNKSTKTFVQKLLKNNEKAKVNIETNQNIEKVQIIDSSSTNVILDLEQMSLSDLKQVAKEKKIKNISKFKKKELIDYLIKIM
ncbi:Rho termination factor N-terminal domain-containing protein, partial [Candidatus Phytoplasma phoenicium]